MQPNKGRHVMHIASLLMLTSSFGAGIMYFPLINIESLKGMLVSFKD
jgi:hypothetical protein